MTADGNESVTTVDEKISEVSLLLPGWQADALQQAACSQGLTIAQLIRRLLSEAFSQGNHLRVQRCAF